MIIDIDTDHIISRHGLSQFGIIDILLWEEWSDVHSFSADDDEFYGPGDYCYKHQDFCEPHQVSVRRIRDRSVFWMHDIDPQAVMA